MALQNGLQSQRKSILLEMFPAEVLLHIFDFAVDHFDQRKEPSIDIGNCSPWSKDLRVKKALVCVCKNWRILALPYLYSRIYLHRVGQLCALVRVLEESSSGHDGTGYSSHVHHIHGRFFVPGSWETVYYKNVIQLLTLCASTRSFSWKIAWGSPIPWRCESSHPISAQCSSVSLIRHSQLSLLPSFSSLQKLTLPLDESTGRNTNRMAT